MGNICQGLIQNQRYGIRLLAENMSDVDEYWEWWWANKARYDSLDRPHTIEDSDAILEHTRDKSSVDVDSWLEFFPNYLASPVLENIICRGNGIPRGEYRRQIIRHLADAAPILDSPVVWFAGGGYGAGKSTVLNFMARNGATPFTENGLKGVDYCKLLLPEFNVVKMLADGRASFICQDEAKAIAGDLFRVLVAEGRSFAWDSSMSDLSTALDKIDQCRRAGYELRMVGVLASVRNTVRRAMERARQIRRFAHPEMLPASIRGFARALPTLVDKFDTVQLFDNGILSPHHVGDPLLIGEKIGLDAELVIRQEAAFREFLKLGETQP